MKFSILIPAYKGRFLQECIESILRQTYSNFEIVIVNDNSPEDLASIVHFFADSRIRYYKNEIGFGAEHVVENWNKCLEYAQGDYVICMGDDDKLTPCCLEEYVNVVEKFPDVDIIYARTEIINEYSEIVRKDDVRLERESVYEMIWQRWHGRSMFIGDYLYKTSVLRNLGGFFDLPFAWGSDAISAYRSAIKNGIVNTQKFGFQYRLNSQTISSNYKNTKGKTEALKEERKWFEDFFLIQPKNESDRKLWENLKRELPLHFEKMYISDITHAMSHRPLREFLFWLKNYKKHKLSLCLIFKCALRGGYNYFKNLKK